MKKEAKFISCGNDFYTKYFDEVCEALEQGETVRVSIDCIGHTRNNMAQEAYRQALAKKYCDKISVKCNEGYCSYSYTYSLAK